MKTLVIQSHKKDTQHTWLRLTLESVRAWSSLRGHDYRFFGDEIFEPLPSWFREKFVGMGAQCSDLARLLMIQKQLANGYERVVWADADLLVFRPKDLSVPLVNDSVFGYETWVDKDSKGKLRHWGHLHNAFMVFAKGSVVLPYLIYSIQSIARRIDKNKFSPQTFGPKLLGALHSISQFEVQPDVGALSPLVAKDVLDGGGEALNLFQRVQSQAPTALNLCLSLAQDPKDMALLCSMLTTDVDLFNAQ